MVDYKQTTLKSRRRHFRFDAEFQVFILVRGLLRRKFAAKLVNPSQGGFQLISSHDLSKKKKAVLRFTNSKEIFNIASLWGRNGKGEDAFVSGWTLLNQSPKEMERF